MRSSHLPIRPTRVNDSFVRGSLYHWDRITNEDAVRLGVLVLPGPNAGSTTRADGVVARRLKCGRMNLVVESTAPLMRDPALARFVDILLDPAEHGSATTDIAPLADGALGGDFEIDAASLTYAMSPHLFQFIRAIHPAAKPVDSVFVLIARAHPEDAMTMVSALHRTMEDMVPWDITYRTGGVVLRSSAAVTARDRRGRPAIISGMIERLVAA